MASPPPAAAYGKMPFGTAPPGGAAIPSATSAPGAMAQLAPNPFAVATNTEIHIPEPKKKTPLVIGAIVLVLAAAGGAVVLTQKPAAPPPPPVPTATTQAPALEAPTPARTSEPSSAPTGPQTGGELPTGPRPAAPAGTDFSQMFAAGAEKAEKGGTSTATKAFDADEARSALAGILKSVAACKEPGGPTGQTSAAVTFAANGQVTGVTVGAPFAGTSTGTCMITAFKAAKVTPFSGLPGTVSQPVSLQ